MNLTSSEQTKKDISELFNLLKSDKPSKNRLEYWLIHCSDIEYKKHTSFGGKWLIFASPDEIDSLWDRIIKMQDNGLLGNISKVSTALGAIEKNSHVICIYSYDSRDMSDLMRIRNNLKENGFEKPLHYKRDIETINGIYGTDNEFLLTI